MRGKLETVIYHKLSVDFVHPFMVFVGKNWPDFSPIKSLIAD